MVESCSARHVSHPTSRPTSDMAKNKARQPDARRPTGDAQGELAPEQALVADVSAQRISRVYAEAVLNAAEKTGQADEVQRELESLLHDLIERDERLAAFLAGGTIGRHR